VKKVGITPLDATRATARRDRPIPKRKPGPLSASGGGLSMLRHWLSTDSCPLSDLIAGDDSGIS
jgi:hypothetical protein